jgi:hypothetical protein
MGVRAELERGEGVESGTPHTNHAGVGWGRRFSEGGRGRKERARGGEEREHSSRRHRARFQLRGNFEAGGRKMRRLTTGERRRCHSALPPHAHTHTLLVG